MIAPTVLADESLAVGAWLQARGREQKTLGSTVSANLGVVLLPLGKFHVSLAVFLSPTFVVFARANVPIVVAVEAKGVIAA